MTGSGVEKDYIEDYREAQRYRKCLFCIVGLLVVVIVCIGVYIVWPKSKAAKELCLTRECIESANMISEYMDDSADPCQDFYQFSCGGFLKSNPGPPYPSVSPSTFLEEGATQGIKNVMEDPNTASQSTAVEKMKTFYRSCVDDLSKNDLAEASRKLKTELYRAGFGKWPEVLLTWDDPSDELFNTEELLSIFPLYDMEILFKLDFSSATGFSIMSKATEELETTEKLHHYKRLIQYVFEHLNVPDSESLIEDILEFENKHNEAVNKLVYEDKDYTLSEFSSEFPQLNWTNLIGPLKRKSGKDEGNWTEGAQMSVINPGLLTDSLDLISATPQRTLYSFLVWRFTLKVLPYIGEPFHREYEAFALSTAKNDTYITKIDPLWKKCNKIVEEFFPKAQTLEYAKVMWDQHMYDEIKYYMDEIKTTFNKRLPLQTWLEHGIREQSRKKVERINIEIAFPPSLMNTTDLDLHYKDIIVKANNLVHNVLLLRRNNAYRKWVLGISEEGWEYNPNFINAVNTGWFNSIVVPIGILNPPYFQLNRPRYLNFGGIGTTLAHELGHSFDNTGVDENIAESWKDEEKEKFMERAKCILDHHSTYPVPGMDPPIQWDGRPSWSDDIADKVGLNIAYRAYLEHEAIHGKEPGLLGLNYTNYQLLFIQFAQSYCTVYHEGFYKKLVGSDHSPGIYRVLGTIVNDPSFGKVFNCPVGTPMNPETKCELWI